MVASLGSSPADPAAAQHASWNTTVGKVVALQWTAILVLSGIAWIWAGNAGAKSLLLGGSAVALPNAVLALWLTVRLYRAGPVGAAGMLTGELLKLVLTFALLVMGVTALKREIVWLALIVGMIAALKAQWLAVWFTKDS